MDKAALVASIVEELGARLAAIQKAVGDARDGATGEDTRAEGKYDTRGLEASYLAHGQAEQAAELEAAMGAVASLPVRDFGEDDPIALGALARVEMGGHLIDYLMVPAGGGIEIALSGGVDAVTLTPAAPMGKALLGKRQGDRVELAGGPVPRVGKVVWVS